MFNNMQLSLSILKLDLFSFCIYSRVRVHLLALSQLKFNQTKYQLE